MSLCANGPNCKRPQPAGKPHKAAKVTRPDIYCSYCGGKVDDSALPGHGAGVVPSSIGSSSGMETASDSEVLPTLVGAGDITGYTEAFDEISHLLTQARRSVARAINTAMTASYFEIGRWIVELEQGGRTRGELYGEQIVDRLSADLVSRFGRGFSRRNLYRFREFYLFKRIVPTALAQSFPLSWSHYLKLMAVRDPQAREFYEDAAIRYVWNRKVLDRQIGSNAFERHQLSKNKAALLEKMGTLMPGDAISAEAEIKDHYVTEFLDLKEEYSEGELEDALIKDLETFLLELGTDFTFWGRQKACRVGTEIYHVDLVFYHRRLRCLVLIDIKVEPLSHNHVGQMNLYVNYAKANWTNQDENHPVGLILCAAKNEAVARYALENLPYIKASEYQRALPDPALLEARLRKSRQLLLELGKRGEDG